MAKSYPKSLLTRIAKLEAASTWHEYSCDIMQSTRDHYLFENVSPAGTRMTYTISYCRCMGKVVHSQGLQNATTPISQKRYLDGFTTPVKPQVEDDLPSLEDLFAQADAIMAKPLYDE